MTLLYWMTGSAMLTSSLGMLYFALDARQQQERGSEVKVDFLHFLPDMIISVNENTFHSR